MRFAITSKLVWLLLAASAVQFDIDQASRLITQRDFPGALQWASKGLAIEPDNPTLNLRKGEALVDLNEPAAALKALAKTPETGESQFFRGTAYQQLEDHVSARRCFLDAWNRGNEDPYVLYSLIREDKQLGDKAAGLEHFKTMLARFPDSAWIHLLLGDAHFVIGETAQAREEYLAAETQMPDLFEPNYRLAYIDFEDGNNSSAERYYRQALQLQPRHPESNVYLGETLRRERKYAEAIDQLRRAIQYDPKASLAYDSLAKAMSDSGRLKEAVDLLRTAEDKFPDNSAFPAMRARILTKLGRTQEAQLDAKRAEQIIADKNKKEELVH